jgi:hypothetical protein
MKDTIARLRELEAAATPGPWTTYHDWEAYGIRAGLQTTVLQQTAYYPSAPGWEDTQLIAEMRNALPALLDRLEKLEAVVEAAEDVAPFLEEGHTLVVALAALDNTQSKETT